MPASEKHATFSIRKATDADAQGILECLRAAFEKYRDSYTPEAFLDTVCTTETIGRRLRDMAVFVGTSDTGQIVGTVACGVVDEEEGHVRGMAVRPEWQGAGLATELLRCVEAELYGRRCSRISLDTTAPLERAMRFYEKNGFHRTGKVTDFFGMPLFEYEKTRQ